MRPRWWLAGIAGGAIALTLLVSVTSVISFAYRSPSLHVAVETAAAVISLVAAQLMYGRFRRSFARGDLIVTASLALFAATNLLFSAVPTIAGVDAGPFTTWAPTIGSTLAAALLAGGAFAAPCRISRPTVAVRRASGICAVALIGIAVVILLAGESLPRAIDPSLSPEDLSGQRIVGAPTLLALQLVLMALFAAAAIGFARAAGRSRDPLTTWFAVGAILAAFARLNYFIFPSLYSDFFYTGDVLRLSFFVALLIGGMQEIRVGHRELEQAAVFDERRRLAREIHDGIAQDLAFIVQQAGTLEGRNGDADAVADIATAARRALDESRGAIAALVRPTDEPIADALTRVARETARRWGATVEANTVDELEVSAPTREALLRIVGESVSNAARHGRAKSICLEVADRPQLCVRISDDGVGFDPASLGEHSGRHGIMGMHERAEQVGAQLRIDSRPGEGTQIMVLLP